MRDAAQDAWRAIEAARDLGFALAGVAPAEPSQHAEHVRGWIARGEHGEMDYLARNLEVRLDPRELVPGAKSILMVADAYAPGAGETTTAGASPAEPGPDLRGRGRVRGRVARYAWGDDYHKVMKKRMHALADTLRGDAATDGDGQASDAEVWRACVDTAPLLEREHAAAAGLGFIGRNTLLIHPRHGSYLLLGALVTTRELAATERLIELDAERARSVGLVPPTDHCGHCTRCIDACPTGCITDPRLPDGSIDPAAPRAIDASRCISYLTIEHRGEIPDDLRGNLDGWVAGCDVCQEVCPFNDIGGRNPLPIHERYAPRDEVAHGLRMDAVARWTDEDRARVTRGSALKRIKLAMWRRNAEANLENPARENRDA
ncbi:MAG: tRNA epoxyqueuosine(34) reductase QueG [Planctomycetota bacterium]